MPKPGLFRSYEGCLAVFLWALVIWGAFTIVLLVVWRWGT